jgi:hypothetical protein
MAYNYNDFQQQYYSKDELGHRTIEYFQSKFECRIEDSREYNQYVRPVPQYRDFYDTSSYKIETQVVPMKAIHLTTDNLNRLIAEQEHMQNLKRDAEEGKRLWIQDCEDRRVREKNLVVQKAWEKYQMLLGLAR